MLLGSTIRFRINACLPVNRNFVAMICQEERTIFNGIIIQLRAAIGASCLRCRCCFPSAIANDGIMALADKTTLKF